MEQEISIDEMITEAAPVATSANYIYAPETLGGLSATSLCILDEVKDWHKKVERQGSREIHPSYLFTLDKILESLHKYPNMIEQAKSVQSIDKSLKQIIDFDAKGKNRIAYIYPFLIRNQNKIVAKIAIISPQKDNKTDINPYRKACFEFSKELIDLILSNRAKKARLVDEDHPGQFLIQTGKDGKPWLYPKLASIEAEISSLVRRGFQPYGNIPMSDFINDFVNYGKSKGNLLEIMPDFHIIVDELSMNSDGSFKSHPEVINQYRALADGLEKFTMVHVKKLATDAGFTLYATRLAEFEKNFVLNAEPGKKQTTDKIRALIELVEDYHFSEGSGDYNKRVFETVTLAVKILRKLMAEKDNLFTRKSSSLYETVKTSVIQNVSEFTKKNLTLYILSPEDELRKAGINDEDGIIDLTERLKTEVSESFGYKEGKDARGKGILYLVDPGYMAAVIHKLTTMAPNEPKYKSQLDIAKAINASLSNPKHPDLNSKLRPDHIVRLMEDVRRVEKVVGEKEKIEEFQKNFNMPSALFAFVAVILIFITASIIMDVSMPLYVGIPVSGILAYLVGRYFRKKMYDDTLYTKSGSSSVHVSGISDFNDSEDDEDTNDKSDKKDKHINKIVKSAEQYIFPKRFQHIKDKIYDQKSFKDKIVFYADDIKRNVNILASENDNDKVASTIEHALLAHSATIIVPNDLVPIGKEDTFIFSHSDLKSPLVREQIAEHFRDEAQKHKHDKKLVKYYTFLINTIEMEYYKYLPNKKKL